MNREKQLKTNIIYNSIGNFIFLVLQWLITILVVKLANYSEAGILSLAMSFANSLYALASFGMRGYQSSDYKYRFNNDTYIKSRIISCLVSSLLFSIFILLNNYTIYTKLCIIFYLFYKCIEAYDDIYYGAIQREWSMKEIGISYILHGIISFLAFLVGLGLFKNLLFAIILMFISSFSITFLYDKKAYQKKCPKKNKTDTLLNLFLICLPLALYSFLFNNLQVYPKYLLERITNEKILGIYSSIASPVLVIQVFAGFLFNPLLNVFTEYINTDKKKEYRKLVNKIYILIICLGISGLIFIYFLGDFSLNLLFGKEILTYSNLLYSTLIVTILISIMTFNNMLLTISRKFSILLRQNLISLVCSIILAKIFIPIYTIYGVNKALILSLVIGITTGLYDIYFYQKKESKSMKKIKQFLIAFGVKHQKVIFKIVPKFIIKKIETFANKSSREFERVTDFDKNLPNGINIIGHMKGQYGLGQGSRCLANAIRTTDVPNNIIDVNMGSVVKHNDTELDNILTKDFKYNINLFHVQPYTNFEICLSQIDNTKNLEGRYNIGYWVYEVEDIPSKWSETYKYVNEIWTPSDFATKAFKKVAPVPVYTIPYGLNIIKDDTKKRSDFNIPIDKFAYLIMYDPRSLAERKNPKASINAYLKAFKKESGVCLVVVVNNANEEELETLKKELKDVVNLTLINKTLEKKDLYALISLCDVYISLHRSEGFGLIMAEAMFLNTVCVATNYSGNLEFMNNENSCLVDYKMIEVDTNKQIVYEKGNKWAEADVTDASRYLKRLYEDKKYYKKLQKNAFEYVNKYLSLEYSGKLMKQRYNEIIKMIGEKENGTKN